MRIIIKVIKFFSIAFIGFICGIGLMLYIAYNTDLFVFFSHIIKSATDNKVIYKLNSDITLENGSIIKKGTELIAPKQYFAEGAYSASLSIIFPMFSDIAYYNRIDTEILFQGSYWIKDKSQNIKNGDIIFQTSKSEQSRAIQLATVSQYSHMGIIYNIDGKYFVYEAIQPVILTPLDTWIERGEKKHYVIKRLKNADEILTNDVLLKMKQIGEKFKGKNYDLFFEWSDNKVYCSELVWKIYKYGAGIEIGNLKKISDFNLSNSEVKKLLKKRYGEKIPMNETVIAPVDMFNSDKLETIIEK